MRNKTVTVNGKQVLVKEKRISELRNELAPSLIKFYEEDLKNTQLADVIPLLEEKISQIFPELSPEDVDNAYPSELEELVQAFIDVNFSGLKKMVLPLSSLIKAGMSKLASTSQ